MILRANNLLYMPPHNHNSKTSSDVREGGRELKGLSSLSISLSLSVASSQGSASRELVKKKLLVENMYGGRRRWWWNRGNRGEEGRREGGRKVWSVKWEKVKKKKKKWRKDRHKGSDGDGRRRERRQNGRPNLSTIYVLSHPLHSLFLFVFFYLSRYYHTYKQFYS